MGISLISLLLICGTLLPAQARASVLDDLFSMLFSGSSSFASPASDFQNVETMPLLKPAMNIDPNAGKGGGGITIVDNSALVPDEGPSGTLADIEKPKNGTISTYIVQPGDSVSSIAAMFGVSAGTILTSNNLTRSSTLQVGQSLIILPITGIKYTVQRGDTLAGIAKQFGGNADEIVAYNSLDSDVLTVGMQLIIPNGEAPATSAPPPSSAPHGITGSPGIFANNPSEPAHDVGAPGTPTQIAYYIAPLAHYVKTQGIHGYNAVDLAAPMGTPIMASAAGVVVVAQGNGAWNGGYGNYVVISHDNGSQTLYAHMSKVAAYDGEEVEQGEVIGYVGETGEATGPHVHFEIRDGIRNPF